MSEEVKSNYEELLEAAEALEILGVGGGKIIGDKRIDGKDIAPVIEMVTKFDALSAGYKGLDNVNIKAMTKEELIIVVSRLCDVYTNIKAAIASAKSS